MNPYSIWRERCKTAGLVFAAVGIMEVFEAIANPDRWLFNLIAGCIAAFGVLGFLLLTDDTLHEERT